MRELTVVETEEVDGGLLVAIALIGVVAAGIAIGLTLSERDGGSCQQ